MWMFWEFFSEIYIFEGYIWIFFIILVECQTFNVAEYTHT